MGIWDKFVWPVPPFAGRPAVVSSPFRAKKIGKKRRHRSVDIMSLRDEPGEPELPWKTKRYETWPGQPIVAAGPGNIWGVGKTKKGANAIIIDHHLVPGYGPLATRYIHLDDIKVKKGDLVVAGTLLGYMGHTGTDTAHLDFAASTDVTDKWGVDPETLLSQWSRVVEKPKPKPIWPVAVPWPRVPPKVKEEKGNLGWLILLAILILSSKR